MSWLNRRLDTLGSAAFGAIGAITFSQAPAFAHACLARLGRYIDDARDTIDRVAGGDVLPWLDADARAQVVTELTRRLTALEQLQQAMLDAPEILRPLTVLRQAEWSIASAAAGDFVPTMPIDAASIAWTAFGVVAAAVCWDFARLAARAVGRLRARRRAAAATPSDAPAASPAKR